MRSFFQLSLRLTVPLKAGISFANFTGHIMC